MARIGTLDELQDVLDAEMSWRHKEIAHFKSAAKIEGATQDAFIRAGIALVYAHWEGFIKRTSEAYLEYVENTGALYRELKTCFAVFGLKIKLQTLTDSKKAKPNIEALDFIFSEMDKPAKMTLSSAIKTESNLTSTVFDNIATSLDIDTSKYATRFRLIDERLVRSRNAIAHGQHLVITFELFIDLADVIIGLMESYKKDIEDAATNQAFRVNPSRRSASTI